MRGNRRGIVGCCMMLVAFAGCGGDATSSRTATQAPAAAQTTSTAGSDARNPIEREFAPNPYREPRPPGAHPHARIDRVIVRELKRGSGPAVRPGDSVYADYIEANYTTGQKFLKAWRHERFGTENMLLQEPLWMHGLIAGMTGMRPGGRRVIIVPRRLSDIHDPDRAGYSYKQIVYWDVVLRSDTRAER